jgi:AcrR family transcriptional regulator
MPRISAPSIDEHKQRTRRAILVQAQRLIAESGSAEISLGDLTSAAGIGRTTFYEYFADRDDVIASLVEEELPGVISDVMAGVSAPTNLGRLVEIIEGTVEFVVDNPVLGLILHTEVPRLGLSAQERIRQAHSALSVETASLYMAGVEEGKLRRLDPQLAGRLIHDSIMSAARTVIGAEDPARRAPVIVEDLKSFLLSGLQVDQSQ